MHLHPETTRGKRGAGVEGAGEVVRQQRDGEPRFGFDGVGQTRCSALASRFA